jgi:hypothetical protein
MPADANEQADLSVVADLQAIAREVMAFAGRRGILAVAHGDYLSQGWPMIARLLKGGQGIVFDVKARLDRAQAPKGIDLWRL